MRTKKERKKNMDDLFAILSRSISSRPLRPFQEALLLRKAAQTPMLTGKHSESLRSRERSHSWMDFFAVSFALDINDIVMHSLYLLTSLELILIPNCSLLYLHSNDLKEKML